MKGGKEAVEGDLRVKNGWSWKRRFVRLENSEMILYKSREAFERNEKDVKRIKLSKKLTLKTYPGSAFGFRLEGKDTASMSFAAPDLKSLKCWWNVISHVVSIPPTQPRAVNQRDLSSTCTGIRKGVLFRSSMQYDLSKIRTVIDLRRPEMSKAKKSLYLNVDTEFVRINLVPSSVGMSPFSLLSFAETRQMILFFFYQHPFVQVQNYSELYLFTPAFQLYSVQIV